MHTALRELKARVRVSTLPRADPAASPARAASARRRPRPRPRCAAPTPGCARSCCPPIRPTRSPTRSTCRSARRRRRSRPSSAGSSSTRRSAWRRRGARSRRYLLEVFEWAGVEAIEAEELAVLPGPRRGVRPQRHQDPRRLGRVGRHRRRLRADRRDDPLPVAARHPGLVHGPALPGRRRRVTKVVGPVLSRVDVPAGRRRRACSARARRFYDRLDGVRELLTDPAQTSVRLVVNPERMVIAEARRTYTYLSLFGYRVDAVVANRLLPDEVTDPWFDAWKDAARRAPRRRSRRRSPRCRSCAPSSRPTSWSASTLSSLRPGALRRARSGRGHARRIADAGLATGRCMGARGRAALRREGSGRVEPQGRRAARHHRGPPPRDLLPDSLRRRRVVDAVVDRDRLEVVFGERG